MSKNRKFLFYLAASYNQQEVMRGRAAQIESLSPDYKRHCNWISGAHDHTPKDEAAIIDTNQIRDSDFFILCNDVGSLSPGKHVELGYVLGLPQSLQIYIVGKRVDTESVFYSHPRVTRRFDTWEELIEYLHED